MTIAQAKSMKPGQRIVFEQYEQKTRGTIDTNTTKTLRGTLDDGRRFWIVYDAYETENVLRKYYKKSS